MNTRRIWSLWIVNRCSTAEIARKLKLPECDMERVVWEKMDEQFMRRNKLLREERA